MEVLLAPSAGFCFGVRRAVEKALSIAKESHRAVYTDGPLIHNPGMLKELETHGVQVTTNPESLSPDSVLVIRAHGIPPERRHYLQSLAPQLIDATCPEVARIQGLIRARVAKKRTILILGDEGHAEVVGLLGHAQGRGWVISSPESVASLPSDLSDVTLVSQTTQDAETFSTVAELVLARYPDAEILDTVCAATKNRQAELKTLAQQVDIIVVVGSPTSANTQRLAEIASRLKPTLLVRSPEDLCPDAFQGIQIAGLTAGASTPDSTIAAVRDWLVSH